MAMQYGPLGPPNTNALMSVGPAGAPWLEVGYPQMPQRGFWEWFLQDQPGIDRIMQGVTPQAQEPLGPPTLPVGAAPPPYGPGPSTLPVGAQPQPGAGPGPNEAAFLGLGQPGAGTPPDYMPTVFGGPSGGGPSFVDWIGGAASDLQESLGGLASPERFRQDWNTVSPYLEAYVERDPLLKYFGVDLSDPLGLGGETTGAGDQRSPLEQAWAAMQARGGQGARGTGMGAGTGSGGPGGGAGGGGSVGSGSGGTSYDLGPYREPPPVPERALPNAPDLSSVMAEIEGAGPGAAEEPTSMWPAALAMAAQAALRLGPDAKMGEILLALGGGMMAGKAQTDAVNKREGRAYAEAEREHKLRVADAKLRTTQIGAEYEDKRADVDYNNRLGEWKRQASVLEATQPQAQMTGAGLVIQDIGPDGNRRVRVDSRPVEDLIQMRAALKGLGAGREQTNDFTQRATNPDAPEDLALNWTLDMLDNPDTWPMIYGDKYPDFTLAVQNTLGGNSAFGAYASNLKGKAGGAMQGGIAQNAMVNRMWMDMLNNPEMQKRYLAMRAGQLPAQE